jgi:predicted RNA-binding protein with PUA-like domain
MKMGSTTTKYWLMKSEPNEYSIDDLKRDKIEMWDGIRNYQVRNFMRDEMRVGDRALFYHSNASEIGVAGEMKIAKKAYPDPTQFDPKNKHFDPKSAKEKPRWLCVDVRFVKKYPRVVTLAEMKTLAKLKNMKLLQKGNRLSVMPISKTEFETICKLANK